MKGGKKINFIKAIYYFCRGESFKGAVSILEIIKKFFLTDEDELSFDEIFVEALRDAFNNQKEYLIDKVNKKGRNYVSERSFLENLLFSKRRYSEKVYILEKKFLKDLKRNNISYDNEEIIDLEKKEFVNLLSPILEDYLIIFGIDEKKAICRNLIRAVWEEMKIKLNKNQKAFNSELRVKIENLTDDVDNIQEEISDLKNKDKQDLFSQVEDLKESFYSSLSDYLINNKFIRRKESNDIIDIIFSNDESLIFVKGKAGYGKSNVLYEVAKKLEDEGISYLPLRLDRQDPSYNNPRQFGESLGLSSSPEKTLSRVAGKEKSVLILDQLDAIRWTSQHSIVAWECTKQIIEQALNYYNMKVIVACRSYDLKNEPQISHWKDNLDFSSIEVKKLPFETVKKNVANKEVEWSKLDDQQREILRIPLHLYLFNEVNSISFSSKIDLFHEYYRNRRVKFIEKMPQFTEKELNETFTELVNKLDDRQSLSLPKPILRNQTAVEGLISLNVLTVTTNQEVSFFHQSFFDYVFAKIFHQNKKDILEWLKEGEQSLFRREQLRQILKFSHRYNRSTGQFLRDIKFIIEDEKIRFHLKHLTLQVVGDIPNPSYQIWKFIGDLLNKKEWREHILFEVLLDNENWFDLLYENRVWHDWIENANENQRNEIINLFRSYGEECWDNIVEILRLCLESRCWDSNLRELVNYVSITSNDGFFEFVLELIELGYFDKYRLCIDKNNPKRIAKLIGVWLERQIEISEEKLMQDYITYDEFIKNPEGISTYLIEEIVEETPKEYINHVLPRIERLIKKTKVEKEEVLIRDKLWSSHFGYGEIGTDKLKKGLIEGMKSAFIKIAQEDENCFVDLKEQYDNCMYITIQCLFLNGWANISNEFADEAIKYITSVLKKVINCSIKKRNGWNDEVRWVAKEVIEVHSKSCKKENLSKLEKVLLSYYEQWDFESIMMKLERLSKTSVSDWKLEKESNITSFGYAQYIYLSGISGERLSREGRGRKKELKRKFGRISPPMKMKVGTVRSPIKRREAEFMSDSQWKEAIKKYKNSAKENTNFLEGGPRELARELEIQAHKYGARFAKLIEEIPLDSHFSYFRAIIRGITQSEAYEYNEKKEDKKPTSPATFSQICSVIKYVSENFDSTFIGEEICRAVGRLKEENWLKEESIIELIIDYASPPHKTETVLGEINKSQDLISNGINTLAGAASEAISNLLKADKNRLDTFKDAIINLVNSNSVSIRACAVRCCLVIWNFNQNLGVDLFLQLAKTDEEKLFATRRSKLFLKNAYNPEFYDELNPIVNQMIDSFDKEVGEVGAEIQIHYWLKYNADEDLVEKSLYGSEANRIGAAKICSRVFYDDIFFGKVIEPLKKYFNDSSEKVREKAARVLIHFDGKKLDKFKEILSSFINSKAFKNNLDFLLRALDKCYKLRGLDEEIFELTDRLSSCNNGEIPKVYHRNSVLVTILLKLYDDNSRFSKKYRQKCLDAFDKMMRVRVPLMMNSLEDIDKK